MQTPPQSPLDLSEDMPHRPQHRPRPRRHGLANATRTLGVGSFALAIIVVIAAAVVVGSVSPLTAQRERSGEVIAVGFLVLASIGTGLAAIAMSLVAGVQIRNAPSPVTGTGSVVTGGIFGAVALTWWALSFFVFAPAANEAHAIRSELANLHMIGNAMTMYSDDYNGYLPPHPVVLHEGAYVDRKQFTVTFSGALAPQQVPVETQATSLSPDMQKWIEGDRDALANGVYTYGGYWFVAHQQLHRIRNPSATVLAFSCRFDPDQVGRAVLFADSHVEWKTEAEFRALLVEQNKERVEELRLKPIEIVD